MQFAELQCGTISEHGGSEDRMHEAHSVGSPLDDLDRLQGARGGHRRLLVETGDLARVTQASVVAEDRDRLRHRRCVGTQSPEPQQHDRRDTARCERYRIGEPGGSDRARARIARCSREPMVCSRE